MHKKGPISKLNNLVYNIATLTPYKHHTITFFRPKFNNQQKYPFTKSNEYSNQIK